MERPPPVPLKDSPYRAGLGADIPAPPSSSKRKRVPDEDNAYNLRPRTAEGVDPDSHTPKRGRSTLRQSEDADASDDASPAQRRGVRRKKGNASLSKLNLRQAAQQQEQAPEPSLQGRGSKFLEGSLTDRPSQKPPSAFTRIIRTDSGNIQRVDELMADYHDGMPTPRVSSEDTANTPNVMGIMQHSNASNSVTGTAESGESKESGFFRFGRSIATSFNPITLWGKIWRDTKEELTLQNIEKARMKAEAEARYAQLKQAGQLGMQGSHPLAGTSKVYAEGYTITEDGAPRDSGVVMDDGRSSREHKRAESQGSQLIVAPAKADTGRSQSPIPDVTHHPAMPAPDGDQQQTSKTLKSRFHVKRPSLSNLRGGLKRVKSELNLATPFTRQSSSSLSPEKQDFPENSALKKCASRMDLKKQHKLSKRVSDLETKLQLARKELDAALVDASPMPKLGNRYERFTPTGTLKRPRFIPGQLPTLPSERLLFTECLDLIDGDLDEVDHDFEERTETFETTATEEAIEARPRTAMDLTTDQVTADAPPVESEMTQHPARASSLVNLNRDMSEDEMAVQDHTDNETLDSANDLAEMNTVNSAALVSNGTNDTSKPADYASLDAKLKSLDKQVKTSRKTEKTKKRKSGVDDEEKTFRPHEDESDDDVYWDEAEGKSRKKRKSVGNADGSPATKRTTRMTAKKSPPNAQKKTNGSTKKANGKAIVPAVQDGKTSTGKTAEQPATKPASVVELMTDGDGDDELASGAAVRTSIDSQGRPLEPLYEEEEETSFVALKDEPSRPTARATPAHPGDLRDTYSSPAKHYPVRSRSTSPYKVGRPRSPAKAGVEEVLMTKAALAAQRSSSRRGRSASPPRADGYSKAIEVENSIVLATPGKGSVPRLPTGANGSPESLGVDELQMEAGAMMQSESDRVAKEDFEWPEDVF